ncbi:hypothetical protein CR205_12715 [Alteribacter lacisalsi]|uniref:CamS family sex pheromone protein n=1 Tax=Alteribacter lacisalsi TaxID=2045244 RepID=A0A2W0HSJ9_9BACI|nr:CamS family sex pheromone protein [Alteribacter lacisalsi]PYZ96568.1 hypothetical protein CR205_12715 [Alteribacter lacisalsi]
MVRRLSVIGLAGVLFLTGCLPGDDGEEDETEVVEEEEQPEYTTTPTIDTPESYYRNVLQDGKFLRSPARGSVSHAMGNRVDVDQFELGLMEIASAHFSRDDYFFQDGQILSGSVINSWLRRLGPYDDSLENANRYVHGLNPSMYTSEELEYVEAVNRGEDVEENEALDVSPSDWSMDEREQRMRENPAFLSHIMEHNYMVQDGEDSVALGGIVIGMGMRQTYNFSITDDDGGIHRFEQSLDAEQVEEAARQRAEAVVSRIRTSDNVDEDTPIVVALYQEERRNSLVPGSFVAVARSDSGDNLGSWETLDEDHYFFPSNQGTENRRDDAEAFSAFKTEAEDFFDHAVGIVGKGRYKSGSMEEFRIEVNLQSHGKAEIIALTQHLAGLTQEYLPFDAPVKIYLESVNGTEAVVVSYPDEEPFIHVH